MRLDEFTGVMRAAGVRSASFGDRPLQLSVGIAEDGGPRLCAFAAIEIEPASDTIPAPEMADPEPVEDKPATECSHTGCHEPKGFSFAPQYCERHGLKALGVST